ncbi:transcription/translation regulatory transformer protein RfaH [Alishewanella jeotgali]|uniref:Transcriptional activator RfaH n=1 Tax=Alishewanella jeotgali KCTC 22429 TaxID=1129374 RepID=H3ZAZ2_9ALTE|nr:transcription/translation regulatory transformer protein RfaH [Alishewanella jeotgali]EHR42106.1 transcriptional activator RfaH [Alishewanella jeotgali KCTC 22429]
MDNWYLIYSKPRQEQRAQQHLANQGFESFAPFIRSKKLRAGKAVIVSEPLFPRYIFLKCPNTPNLSCIRSTRGVGGLVRFGDTLATVPNQLVQSLLLQQLELQQQPEQQPFKTGEQLAILAGPFASLNAVFQQPDGETRSIILLSFLGQQLKITIDNKHIEKSA